MKKELSSLAIGAASMYIITALLGGSQNIPEDVTNVGQALIASPQFVQAESLGGIKQSCVLTEDPNDIAAHLDLFAIYFRDRGLYPEKIEDPENLEEIIMIDNPETHLELYERKMKEYFRTNVEAGINVVKYNSADEAYSDFVVPEIK